MVPEDTLDLPIQSVEAPAAFRVPSELWINIAITLRDLPPLPHINIIPPSSDRLCSHNGRHSPKFCFVGSNTRLRHLSSACRFLHDLLQHLLYNEVIIDGRTSQRTRSIVNTFTHRSELLAYPRTIIISNFDALSYHLPLTRFLRLEHIYIHSSTITPEITQFLVDAIHLRSLSLERCTWAAEFPPDWSKGRFGGQLTSLSLRVGAYFWHDYIPDPPRLRQLFVSTIVELGIDDVFFLRHDTSWTSSLARLTTLSIDSQYNIAASMLSALLVLLPSVEELHMDALYEYDSSHNLAAFLPRLRSLTGSFQLARQFAGRSKINALRIQAATRSGRREDVELVEDCILLFPSLRRLLIEQVQCDEETLRILATQYPLLTHLVIYSHRSPNAMQSRRDMIPWIGGLSQLQVLRLVWVDDFTPAFPLDGDVPLSDDEITDQRDVLVEIKDRYCPSLQEARIASGCSWSYLPSDGWTVVRRQFIDEGL